MRLIWAFALAFITFGLIVVGGLNTVQSSTIITALPLVPVLLILIVSLLRWLGEDFGEIAHKPVLALERKEDGSKIIHHE